MSVQQLILKRAKTDKACEALIGTWLTDKDYDLVITEDTDAYTTEGEMLFRFRKNVIPFDILKLGYDSFHKSITWTEGRGSAAGKTFKRVRKDGSIGNTKVSNQVQSGNVGSMDPSAINRFCRRTAFAHDHFELFKAGVPFVEFIDQLYKELCPMHYAKQKAIADGTNRNYVIGNTAFTTVTVNRNFQTAVHKDAGDLPAGFGNLFVYREGSYTGSYTCLPEFRAAVDMQNCDALFMDVHRWHGNTPFHNCSEDYLRIAFVMYYREMMYTCKSPSEELNKVKMERGGFLKL